MRKKVGAYYEIAMGVLALLAVSLAVLDLTRGLSGWQSVADSVILIIFILDYLVRLIRADNKKNFIKSNIFDLIAIIPFSSFFRAFRVARLARLAKLTRLSKFSRLVVYSLRFMKRARIFLDTNGFKYMLGLCCALVVAGGIAIHYAENMDLDDGFWWAFVTATTVGYGDISPGTSLGRIIAIILMITGIGLLGTLTSTITSFFLNIRENNGRVHKSQLIELVKRQIDDIDNLSNEEIDRICEILKTFRK